MNFPRTVFKNGGNLDRAGGKYSDLLVLNQAQFDKALEEGWSATLPEAINPPQKEDNQPDDAPPTREEMEAKARELGIKFDGRIGDKKLLALIEKALEA